MPSNVRTAATAIRANVVIFEPVSFHEPAEARQLRNQLVDSILARGDLRRGAVAAVMRDVPRHLFVPEVPLDEAYRDHPVAIGSGQTISQPTVVAMMTEAMDLHCTERVLEVGTGCGYQTAILARLAREVFTIERIDTLALRARQRFARLDLTNVHSRIGDGYRGWIDQAPFDRILLTAAPPQLPELLLSQLADGGLFVGPIGEVNEDQVLRRIRRRGDQFEADDLGAVRFVPMVRSEDNWLN